jgi:hypothetical protein
LIIIIYHFIEQHPALVGSLPSGAATRAFFYKTVFLEKNCLSKKQRTANSQQFRIYKTKCDSPKSPRKQMKVPDAVLDFLVTFWSSKK